MWTKAALPKAQKWETLGFLPNQSSIGTLEFGVRGLVGKWFAYEQSMLGHLPNTIEGACS